MRVGDSPSVPVEARVRDPPDRESVTPYPPYPYSLGVIDTLSFVLSILTIPEATVVGTTKGRGSSHSSGKSPGPYLPVRTPFHVGE